MGYGPGTSIFGFAHRGAPRSRAEHNTLAAFQRALELGAGGLETDIALTADGVPVLAHPRVFLNRGPRLSALPRAALPGHIPSLDDLYRRCGTDFDLSLDMGEPEAAGEVVATAERYGAVDRLWLTYWRVPALAAWRARWPHVRLVYPTFPLGSGRWNRLLQELADVRVDAVNLHHLVSTPRLIAGAQSRGFRVFAWGIRSRRPLLRALGHGVDGVYCDDVRAMVEALRSRVAPPLG